MLKIRVPSLEAFEITRTKGVHNMAMKRPTPKTLSPEAVGSILAASAAQTGKTVRAKSYDPDFPVFDIPVNSKVLVYIPNHIVTMPDGTTDLVKDKFAAHATITGREFGNFRCTSGIVDESLGLDGTCPFCDSIPEVWELFKKEYDAIAQQRGIPTDSEQAKEGLKSVRTDLMNKMAVKAGEVWLTFPIVVIDCIEKDGKMTTTPKLDDEKKMSGKVFWYSIREKTYNEKWGKAFETVTTANGETPTHPAGMWAVLNYEVDAKNGNADKMQSAKALVVGFKQMPEGYSAYAKFYDEMAAAWTPSKAMEVLVDNAIRDDKEQKEACDEVMKLTRDRLSMYSLSTTPARIGASSAESALEAFGVPAVAAPAASMPNIGEFPSVGVV